jgi:hypothetical protein
MNNSSLFMSMLNLILLNINIMNMRRHMLIILFFVFMLMDNKRGEIVIKIKEILIKKVFIPESSGPKQFFLQILLLSNNQKQCNKKQTKRI